MEEANARQLATARASMSRTDGGRASAAKSRNVSSRRSLPRRRPAGDLAELERLFASDAVSQADGGGFIRAAQKPVIGRERVAKYIATIAPWGWSGLTIAVTQVNGQACALLSRAGVVVMLVTIEASPEGIDQIMWVTRTSKLTGVAAASGSESSAASTRSP